MNLPTVQLKWVDLRLFKPAPTREYVDALNAPLGGEGCRHVRSDHLLRIYNTIEFSFRHEA